MGVLSGDLVGVLFCQQIQLLHQTGIMGIDLSHWFCLVIKGTEYLFTPPREVVGKCPRCGGEVAELQKGFFCQNDSCKFAIWKNNKWWAAKKKQPTKAVVSALLKDGRVRVTGLYSEKTGKTYDATVVLEDDGQYANFKLEFDQRKGGSR